MPSANAPTIDQSPESREAELRRYEEEDLRRRVILNSFAGTLQRLVNGVNVHAPDACTEELREACDANTTKAAELTQEAVEGVDR